MVVCLDNHVTLTEVTIKIKAEYACVKHRIKL